MFFVLYHFRYLPEGAFPYVNTFSASFALYHISYLPKGTSTFINAFSAVFIFLYFTIFAITEYPNRGGVIIYGSIHAGLNKGQVPLGDTQIDNF